MCKYGLIAGAFLAILTSCVPAGSYQQQGSSTETGLNSFMLGIQKAPPRDIQSIQLYRKGSANNPPVISLNSSQTLQLEFDRLGSSSKQFKAKVKHLSKSWGASPITPSFYLDGFEEVYFSRGLKSFSQRPPYMHYTYEFPNNQLSFKASGNYLLEIYDYDGGQLLFSLPFFVSEDAGRLDTRIETLYNQRNDIRASAQPFSKYTYPDFVDFPQFDLSFVYVQNRFWGRAQATDLFDTSTPGVVNFHLGRGKAFLANYEFKRLDLRTLKAGGKRILEVNEGTTPPTVLLRRDIQQLDIAPSLRAGSRFGLPLNDRGAAYANVNFRLDAKNDITPEQKIYLVGDFNGWMINELNRMNYSQKTKLWEGQAFIKEGEYAYKYVLVKNNRVDDLALDQSFSFSPATYLTFVYYKDPQRNFDRLLKVRQTTRQ